MIQANELRIGNWAINDCDDSYIKLTAADILTASHDDDWLLPIPLTPEILQKAGFSIPVSSYEGCRLQVTGWLEFWWDNVDGLALQTISTGWKWNQPHIKYLHQLQNLYHALTGEELPITL